MPRPTKIEIIDTVSTLLEEGKYSEAISYLRKVREIILKEAEQRIKLQKRRRSLVDRCIDLLLNRTREFVEATRTRPEIVNVLKKYLEQ